MCFIEFRPSLLLTVLKAKDKYNWNAFIEIKLEIDYSVFLIEM